MPKVRSKKSKYIFLFLRIAVIAAGITWAVSRIGQEQRWGSFVEYFRRMNIWIFAGVLGIFLISHILVGLRWWLLLRTQSIFIEFWAAVRLYFLGWFYNNFMPSSLGGDLIRAWYVTKHTEKKLQAVLSVFVDRVIGLFSTLAIAVFFYLLFLHGKGTVITRRNGDGLSKLVIEYKWVFLWIFVVVATIFGVLLLHKRGRVMLKKAWYYVCVHVVKVIEKLKDAAILYCRKPWTILTAFGLTVFVQLLAITGFWFLGESMGITASIKYYYVFFTLTWVLGAIPISIGGAVVVEGSLVILFTRFASISEPAAWAIALCQRLVWMLTSLPGALIHLFGAHLPKEFFIDYEKSVE